MWRCPRGLRLSHTQSKVVKKNGLVGRTAVTAYTADSKRDQGESAARMHAQCCQPSVAPRRAGNASGDGDGKFGKKSKGAKYRVAAEPSG